MTLTELFLSLSQKYARCGGPDARVASTVWGGTERGSCLKLCAQHTIVSSLSLSLSTVWTAHCWSGLWPGTIYRHHLWYIHIILLYIHVHVPQLILLCVFFIALLDIPVYNSRIHSLHVLFSLYMEFKNSQVHCSYLWTHYYQCS